ncbi:MAG: hypothetical protein JO303_09430 [Caulobacteraceae bacterium]|nr:hypothetical protein [Caulobacteraceae bacterium]
MSIDDILSALQDTPVAQAVADSAWIFPTTESIHVAAITLVVGAVALVDLRLIGVASTGRSVRELETQYLPITWAAFAVGAITGAVMFLAKPTSYAHNPFFLAKLVLLGLAAVNMLVFHFVVEPRQTAGRGGQAARVSGAVSLAIWIGVIAVGRWIGFVI